MTEDDDAALARFRTLLQIPTVSHTDDDLIEWAPFDDFLAEVVRL